MTWQQALDELRLRYAEEAQQISLLEAAGKRSKEELAQKRVRLDHLKSIGVMVAEIAANEPAVLAALGKEAP
jgi:adenine-specific DNA methylase